jgi:hypothetical protein
MNVRGGTNSVTFTLAEFEGLAPSPTANQTKPKGCYVYAHCVNGGKIFYIGKGSGQRAWSDDRHPLWTRYVENHLHGHYHVVILADGLTASQAEEVENDWVAQEAANLINWVNLGRKTDFAALDRMHRLRSANRALLEQAKALESIDPKRAIELYVDVINTIPEYATIQPEPGLVGQLINEEWEELGISGEIFALDRLTLLLCEAGEPERAANHCEEYFRLFRRDKSHKTAERIAKRLEKARKKANA